LVASRGGFDIDKLFSCLSCAFVVRCVVSGLAPCNKPWPFEALLMERAERPPGDQILRSSGSSAIRWCRYQPFTWVNAPAPAQPEKRGKHTADSMWRPSL
jgi:hypothetical protein